jgi:hypothetical protein
MSPNRTTPAPVGQGGTPDSASVELMGLRRSLERLADRQRLLDYTERPLNGCYHPRRSSRAPARGKFVTTGATKPSRGAQGVLIASPSTTRATCAPPRPSLRSRTRLSKLLRLLRNGALVGHPRASISLSCRRQQTEVALR